MKLIHVIKWRPLAPSFLLEQGFQACYALRTVSNGPVLFWAHLLCSERKCGYLVAPARYMVCLQPSKMSFAKDGLKCHLPLPSLVFVLHTRCKHGTPCSHWKLIAVSPFPLCSKEFTLPLISDHRCIWGLGRGILEEESRNPGGVGWDGLCLRGWWNTTISYSRIIYLMLANDLINI